MSIPFIIECNGEITNGDGENSFSPLVFIVDKHISVHKYNKVG